MALTICDQQFLDPFMDTDSLLENMCLRLFRTLTMTMASVQRAFGGVPHGSIRNAYMQLEKFGCFQCFYGLLCCGKIDGLAM
jgi:hypothetical protein